MTEIQKKIEIEKNVILNLHFCNIQRQVNF